MPSHYQRKRNFGSSAPSESSKAAAKADQPKKAKTASPIKQEQSSDEGDIESTSERSLTPVDQKYGGTGYYETTTAYGTWETETKRHKGFRSVGAAEAAELLTPRRRTKLIELQPVPRGPKIKFSGQPAFWLPVGYKGPIDVKYAVAIQAPICASPKLEVPNSKAKYRLSQ